MWQGEVGTEAQPWLGDHQIHNVAALPGAAYCEMALAAARTVLGEASEVRDIRFEQMLLLDDETPVVRRRVGRGARRPRLRGGDRPRRRTRPAGHRGSARRARMTTSRPRYDIAALLADHPSRVDGAELRTGFDARGIQYGPAFSGLAAAHTAEGTVAHRAGRGRHCPGRIRSQQACLRRFTPRCSMRASSPSWRTPTSRTPAPAACCCRWACAGCAAYGPTRNAHYCYDPGDRADARRSRGRPRRPRRARHRPADRATGCRLGTGRLREQRRAIAC